MWIAQKATVPWLNVHTNQISAHTFCHDILDVLLHVVVLCFLQVFRSSNYAFIGKKGRRFQLGHQFVAVFLLGQDMEMSLYIELDCHS